MWQNRFRSPTPSECSDDEGEAGPQGRPDDVLKRQLDLNQREDRAVPKYNPFTLAKAYASRPGEGGKTHDPPHTAKAPAAWKSSTTSGRSPSVKAIKPAIKPAQQWKKPIGPSKITFDKIPADAGHNTSAYPILDGLEKLRKRQEQRNQEQAKEEILRKKPQVKPSASGRPKPTPRTGRDRVPAKSIQDEHRDESTVHQYEVQPTIVSSQRILEVFTAQKPSTPDIGSSVPPSKDEGRSSLLQSFVHPHLASQPKMGAMESVQPEKQHSVSRSSTGHTALPPEKSSITLLSQSAANDKPFLGLQPRARQVTAHPLFPTLPRLAIRQLPGGGDDVAPETSKLQARDLMTSNDIRSRWMTSAERPEFRHDASAGTNDEVSMESPSPIALRDSPSTVLGMTTPQTELQPSNDPIPDYVEGSAEKFRPRLLPRSGTNLPLHHIDARYDADEALRSSSAVAKAKAAAFQRSKQGNFVASGRVRGAMAGAAYEAREVDLDQLFRDDGNSSVIRHPTPQHQTRNSKPFCQPPSRDQSEAPISPSWSTMPLTKRELLKQHNQRDIVSGRSQAPLKIAGNFMLPAQMLGGPHARNPTVWREPIEHEGVDRHDGRMAGLSSKVGQRSNRQSRGSTTSGAAYEQDASSGSSPQSDLRSMIMSGQVVKLDRKITLFAPSMGTMSKVPVKKIDYSSRMAGTEDEDHQSHVKRNMTSGSNTHKQRGGHDSGREDIEPGQQERRTQYNHEQNPRSDSESSTTASARSLGIGSSPLAQYLFRNKQHDDGFVSAVLGPDARGNGFGSTSGVAEGAITCNRVAAPSAGSRIPVTPRGDLSKMYAALSYEGEPVPGRIDLKDISAGIARRYHLARQLIQRKEDQVEERYWDRIGVVEAGGSGGADAVVGAVELFEDGFCTDEIMRLIEEGPKATWSG